mgnify:CR=1 FL=1
MKCGLDQQPIYEMGQETTMVMMKTQLSRG